MGFGWAAEQGLRYSVRQLKKSERAWRNSPLQELPEQPVWAGPPSNEL
ncbi:hypothetical protein BN873_p40002 [Candidatus Competibacter denitrificans Run_A_D11]|uniref:Uncharacterized protein n=1 Tax=Candidatus Competibacter denitrificans Run_A_D11 TaxID=1400863 RepID=W6MAC5_9GAMM|nr:hypothetical protein BN873_p40002 [Candidatus Competibacter denitrificans Run_A_D11]